MTEAFKRGYMDKLASIKKEAWLHWTHHLVPWETPVERRRKERRANEISDAKRKAISAVENYAGAKIPAYGYEPANEVLELLKKQRDNSIKNENQDVWDSWGEPEWALAGLRADAANTLDVRDSAARLHDAFNRIAYANWHSRPYGAPKDREDADMAARSTAVALRNLAMDVDGNPREPIDVTSDYLKGAVDSAADALKHFPTTPEGTNSMYTALSAALNPRIIE